MVFLETDSPNKRCWGPALGARLLLLTNRFPFESGEEYLETEIEYLSAEFREIVILPVMIAPGDAPSAHRLVPRNCRIIPVGPGEGLKAKLTYVVRYLGRVLFTEREMLSGVGFHPLRILYQLYFSCRVEAITETITSSIGPELARKEWIAYSYWLYATAAAAVRVRINYPTVKYAVSRAHRYDVDVEASPLRFLPARRYLIDNLDSVYPVGSNGAEQLKRVREGEGSAQVAVRRLGVASIGAPRRRFSGEEIRFISCSTFNPLKRLPLLIETIGAMQSCGVKVTWSHIGASDHRRMDEMEELASRSLRPGTYEFLGRMSNLEVRRELSNPGWHFFIGLASSEGVPVSCMEALSAGLPIIYTAVGDVPDLLVGESGGLLLGPDGGSAEYAASICDWVDGMSKEEYEAQSRSALSAWRTRWSADENYSTFACDLSSRA